MSPDLPDFDTATAFKPGDKVLVTMVSDDMTRENADALTTALGQRFPGVDFTIMAGVSGIAVQEKTDD